MFATKRGFRITADNFAEKCKFSVLFPLYQSWMHFVVVERMLQDACVWECAAGAAFGLHIDPARTVHQGGGDGTL